MAGQDFFTFCTTLKPLELKALGELGFIQHLASDRILYNAGDPSTTLYLVTRGAIELIQQGFDQSRRRFVTRGEFVGDLDTFTDTPRRCTAWVREAASVQCFLRDDFPELLRRVPSFFLFLTRHFAERLQRMPAHAAAPNESLELSGNLANFDLVTVYQTILNSAQTGELRVRNDKGDTIAVFFFQDGHPRTGQFAHLTGEEAFIQFFLAEHLSGTFLFSSGDAQISASIQSGVITRHASDMLINALQARDELQVLKERLGSSHARLYRRKIEFSWPDDAPEALRETAHQVWELAYSRPLTPHACYERCSVSELKIYESIDVLITSGHFDLLGEEIAKVA